MRICRTAGQVLGSPAWRLRRVVRRGLVGGSGGVSSSVSMGGTTVGSVGADEYETIVGPGVGGGGVYEGLAGSGAIRLWTTVPGRSDSDGDGDERRAAMSPVTRVAAGAGPRERPNDRRRSARTVPVTFAPTSRRLSTA
jgi:hypothetical protein